MKLEKRIILFSELGNYILKNLKSDELQAVFSFSKAKNAWFTLDNIELSVKNIAENFLSEKKLNAFINLYPNDYFEPKEPKKVGIVAAGNIPAVGFQDLLHVVLSGHIAYFKPSSQDEVLIGFFIKKMIELNPEISSHIIIADKLNNLDAYIATGSGNTSRYFEYYFGNKPNIIRKNRISVSVLSGQENAQELSDLGTDILSYFGLGCRNVSKLFVPKAYDFVPFFEAIEYWNTITLHSKYLNNYEYNKSILLVNRDQHFDNGFLLLKPSEAVYSPISTVFYEEYERVDTVKAKLETLSENLQCVVSNFLPEGIPFGKSQSPELWDYADGVDTMAFLEKL